MSPVSSARRRTVAAGLGFTEGPLWTASQQLLVVSVSRGVIYELGLEGGSTTVAETGGNPTGLAQDAAGDVWVAQGGRHTRTRSERPVAPGIQRVRDGRVEDVVTSGRHAPNDCAVGPQGRLWFTDPRGPAMSADGPAGEVCALDPESGELEVVLGGLRYPNGLAFSRDGRTLWVAETGRERIRRFAVEALAVSGAAPAARAAASECGRPLDLPRGHPDGLAVDDEDRVHAAAISADAVIAFTPDGVVDELIELEDGCAPTNLCFGGPGGTTLFVTVVKGGRVLAIPREVPGGMTPAR
jgi:gluconolactonase